MKKIKSSSVETVYNIRFFFSKPELYSENVTLLCFNKSRKYSLGTAADLISAAYEHYMHGFPEDILDIMSLQMAAKALLDHYQILNKRDIYLFLDHPKYIKSPEKIVTRPWKRVVFDYDNNLQHREAYDWLNEYTPRERIEIALPVLKQFLVLTSNAKYIEQTSLRLMKSFEMLHTLGKKEELASCIDLIWRVGS